MSRIVFTAAPYGYGPTSKALCLAEALAGRHDMVYVGMQPGVSLARESAFGDVLEITNRDTWTTESLRVLAHADLLVSALDYRALPLAADRGVPSVFLDTLLWLRDVPPPHVELASAYVAQRFAHPGSGAACQLKERLQEVGPILPTCLDRRQETPKKAGGPLRILICVGGLRSPAMAPGADCDYLRLLLALLEKSVPTGTAVCVALPQYLRAHDCHAPLTTEGYRTLYPNQTQFYGLLQSAHLLVTTPGLEVVYEAVAANVPLLFLPPYNATQLLQARAYAEAGIAFHSVVPSWATDAALTAPIAGSGLNNLTRKVQAMNARLVLGDQTELTRLRCAFAEALQRALGSPQSLERTGRDAQLFLARLGSSGREHAASIVTSAISPSALWG